MVTLFDHETEENIGQNEQKKKKNVNMFWICENACGVENVHIRMFRQK